MHKHTHARTHAHSITHSQHAIAFVRWSVAAFFRPGNIQELQHRALAVVRANYTHSPDHRAIVLDEILMSLGRSTASRRDLKT